MDAENENEQPISSSASSSNSSSSSNLLINLPMLPMLQSHDDEDLEAQEHMPPHPPSTPPPSLSLVSNQQHLSQQQAAASSPAAEQQQQLQQHLPTEMSPLLFNNNTTPPPSSSSSSSSSSSHNHQLHQHFQHSEHHYHHQHHHQYHHQQQQHEQQLQQHSSPPSPTQQPPQQQQLQQQPQQQEFSAEDDDEDIADSIDASAIDANDQQQAAIVANVVNLNVDVASTSQQREQRDVQPERSQTLDVAVGVASATNEPHLLPPPQLPLSLPREEFKRHHQLHSSSSQFPRSHHHYHSSTGCCNNIFSGSNANNNNNSNIMFTNNDNDGEPHTSNTSQHHQHQAVDRLKMLYPNVNENETPLPRCWSSHDKCLAIGLSQNNLRVHYKGAGKQHNDAASVRTAHPIPPACGLYYFEVKIISKGKNGYMGIGLTAQQFRMNRLPGWDKQSYGYHGDDGNSFSSSGNGQSYGPTFTTGDIIGCCVNFVNNTCFYTKNGIDLGIAFRDLPSKLYPTVGLQTPGEEVDANFGQEPFKFDQIEDMIKQLRAETKAAIYDFPMPVDQGDPTTLLHKMVSSYLVHNGYSLTAEAFAGTTGQSFSEDLSSIKNRQKILKLVMSGKMGQAIEHTLGSYPGLLENNKNLLFMLKCRQFIEMVNGSDVEFCPANNKLPINIKNVANNTTVTTQTQTTPPNQTSVIQSTKSYQNGNVKIENATINAQDNAPNTTVISADNHQEFKNSLSIENSTVDNQAISNKSNDVVVANNYYLHDVEMENGHHANGNTCKNGNSTNFNNTLDLDEDMDVDLSPSTRKYCHGFERILEFGKELSQMGQQLEKENKMNDEDRQMLEDAFSLIAYSNPWSSPLGWQLCPSKREAVCSALNSAILESMNYPWRPPLEVCVAHASELLKVMAQASLGACAFVNIEDVFPQN